VADQDPAYSKDDADEVTLLDLALASLRTSASLSSFRLRLVPRL
jgi:hypothetical protein